MNKELLAIGFVLGAVAYWFYAGSVDREASDKRQFERMFGSYPTVAEETEKRFQKFHKTYGE